MKVEKQVDVLIVGAGLSGLTAAYELELAGKRVALLEARHRIGGRILSVMPPHSPGSFDLGPAWFWGHNQQVIDLMEQLGLTYFEQFETGDNLFERQPGAMPERFSPQWQQPVSYRLDGGTIALAEALSQRIAAGTIFLNHVIYAISLVDDSIIHVQTVHAGVPVIWRANDVIVTLPPHLAATTIVYDPVIPDNVRQVMRHTPTWMGEAMKVLLVYKRPFWRDANLSGMGVSYAGPVQQFHDASPANAEVGALFGWVGNHSVARQMTQSERQTAVIQQAIRLFGSQAAQPLYYDEMNWEQEPFTTNSNDDSRLIATEHPEYGHPLLQQPQMNGRLWWATTEAAPVGGGYLDGAIYLGRRVAECIVQKTAQAESETARS